MEWVMKKRKAFDQRGDMAVAAWAEQQQREMTLRARRLSRSKVMPKHYTLSLLLSLMKGRDPDTLLSETKEHYTDPQCFQHLAISVILMLCTFL
jgi:hypothetical protein